MSLHLDPRARAVRKKIRQIDALLDIVSRGERELTESEEAKVAQRATFFAQLCEFDPDFAEKMRQQQADSEGQHEDADQGGGQDDGQMNDNKGREHRHEAGHEDHHHHHHHQQQQTQSADSSNKAAKSQAPKSQGPASLPPSFSPSFSQICLHTTFPGHQEPIGSLCFSPSGALLASGSHDTSVQIYDLRASDPDQARLVIGARERITAVAFTAEGILAVASEDCNVRFYSVAGEASAKLTREVYLYSPVTCMAAGAGVTVAGTHDAKVYWVNATNGNAVAAKGHENSVLCVAVSNTSTLTFQ